VGYNIFQKRGKGEASGTDFVPTVLSLPPGVDSLPASADSLPHAADSLPAGLDSLPAYKPSDLGADSLPAPAAEAAVEQRPTLSHIGRYALKGLLAHGGLGQVHEAWDPLLSRIVAIKTLQFDVDTPARVSLDGLFLNEARAAAGLSHPHIVTIHDAGLSAHGVYIAMERLYGADLRQKLSEGWRPKPGHAAQMVRRIADALAYAHSRGVVHCDIKPANIFLNRHDKPKLLDFGIARVAHSAAVPGLEGVVAGSPHYLAPEQLSGGTVDARTDVHALGVVFYELLTGRKAFGGDTLDQITTAVLAHNPAAAHEINPTVSRTLSAIAAKAMARLPEDRYPSADAMAADLRRWIERHTAHDTSVLESARTPRPVGPRRKTGGSSAQTTTWLVLGALSLGLLLALAFRAGSTLRPTREPAASLAAPAPPSVAPAPAERPATATDPRASAPSTAAAPTGQAAPVPVPLAATPAAARVRRAAAAPGREARAPAAGAPAVPATGTVQLAISPWGEVEIDGAAAGTAPPLTQVTLSEGIHTVTVRNADFTPYSATVQVSASKPVSLHYRFGP
jgi:serine/threonine-protein kinase